ncbi:MAG: hypothetical protein E7583_00705 [Ruminococcaceae bacterium]|nr:hypothetical protein [Oscillospiraceae bacterium]
MEYLRITENGNFSVSGNIYNPGEFDTKGLKARIKVTDGTFYLYCGSNGKYTLEKGDTLEFVGKIYFYGVAEVQYILFDQV